MHTQTSSEENTAFGIVPTPRPQTRWRVTNVEALPGYKLRVVFRDNLEGVVDMSALVHAEDAGVFAALVDPELFAKVYIEFGVVTWPGEIDLAPDAMYDEIKKNGIWILT